MPDGFDCFCVFHGSNCPNYSVAEAGRAIYTKRERGNGGQCLWLNVDGMDIGRGCHPGGFDIFSLYFLVEKVLLLV